MATSLRPSRNRPQRLLINLLDVASDGRLAPNRVTRTQTVEAVAAGQMASARSCTELTALAGRRRPLDRSSTGKGDARSLAVESLQLRDRSGELGPKSIRHCACRGHRSYCGHQPDLDAQGCKWTGIQHECGPNGATDEQGQERRCAVVG